MLKGRDWEVADEYTMVRLERSRSIEKYKINRIGGGAGLYLFS